MTTLNLATYIHPTGTGQGQVKYVHIGRIVVFYGYVEVTTALTGNGALFSGLPIPELGNSAGFYSVNTTAGTASSLTLTADGQLNYILGLDVGWHRISGCYLANTNG